MSNNDEGEIKKNSCDQKDKKRLNKEFIVKYGINIINIIAQGSPYSRSSSVFERHIPHKTMYKTIILSSGKMVKRYFMAYRCCANPTDLIDQIHK